MSEYVGFDVSKEETAFCVKDKDGKVLARGKVATDPQALFEVLKEHCLCPERVVMETGTLCHWLARELGKLGMPVVLIDARQAHAVMKLQHNKTDANDADLLAEIARTGFYRPVAVKKLGTVALDGTKVHANASRHSALSWKHACELEARLKAEVAELMALAEAADGADVPDGMSVPEELARREDRLARIAEAKAVIEARARERLERERAEYEAKLEARAEKAEKTGRKPGGRPPEPPVAGPGPKDQVNLTDADSRIMPVAGGGFEQAYNAQALVAADSLLVVTNDVVQAPNDKRQIEPALEALARLPEALGAPETLLADSGYFSEANVNACAEAEIAPLITPGRERHHLSWKDRFAGAPPPPENPTPLEAMTHRLATPEGRQLYALRKQTPEPVFGIIKSAMGFRQFSLRGLDKVTGEWNLVTLAWNIKRMFTLQYA